MHLIIKTSSNLDFSFTKNHNSFNNHYKNLKYNSFTKHHLHTSNISFNNAQQHPLTNSFKLNSYNNQNHFNSRRHFNISLILSSLILSNSPSLASTTLESSKFASILINLFFTDLKYNLKMKRHIMINKIHSLLNIQ